jgi:hypothetical protein
MACAPGFRMQSIHLDNDTAFRSHEFITVYAD